MLKTWKSHSDYKEFLISKLSSLYKSIPKQIEILEPSISKLYCLDLDILKDTLKPYYSSTGRLATFQPEIFLSL